MLDISAEADAALAVAALAPGLDEAASAEAPAAPTGLATQATNAAPAQLAALVAPAIPSAADSSLPAGGSGASAAKIAASGAVIVGPAAAADVAVTSAVLAGEEGKDASPPAARKAEPAQTFGAQLQALQQARADQAAGDAPRAPDQSVPTAAAPATTASASAAAATPQHALARADAPVPLQALAVEIGMRAMRGAKEFSIRLDPEDLGRIDVRLEISEKGEVQAKVVVDRVETLQLLQRDARTLERAFDQAGLKTNPDGLQFSLRDPGQQGQQNGRGFGGEPSGQRDAAGGDRLAADDIKTISAIYRAPANGAVDIRI
jgi:flagellar hook-length control protein FliK